MHSRLRFGDTLVLHNQSPDSKQTIIDAFESCQKKKQSLRMKRHMRLRTRQ